MYEKSLSKHVQIIKPSGTRKYFDLVSEMEGAISLDVGEPDFDTPWHICEATIYSVEGNKTHYITNQDLLELRGETCLYQKRRPQLDYGLVDNVIVTIGNSKVIDIAMRAVASPGGKVILMESSYVAYTPSVELINAAPTHTKLEHEDQFKLTPEKLKAAITPKTKAILINFLSNPTGGVIVREDYAKLVPILKEHEIIVISDEVYVELTYGGTSCSPADLSEIKDQVIITSGFSKTHVMTDWWLSYALTNETLMDVMNKIYWYIIVSAPTAAQYDAIDTMRSGDIYVAEMRESYMTRRDLITKGFNRIGLPTHLPHGAFYVFLDIRGIGLTSDEFCVQLLEDQRVACVLGTAFGDAGKDFIRVSHAHSIGHIREVIECIGHFMEKFWQK